jgi:DNA invertase Pin-like site-specific DNA recombinase
MVSGMIRIAAAALHHHVAGQITQSGRLLCAVLGAVVQLEVEALCKRTRSGLRFAAQQGRKGGRPPVLDETKLRAAKAMLASGTISAVEVARHLGCAPSTLYRHIPGGRSAVAA